MDTERVNSWLSLIAKLAVLVGIIFLALEIRQSNRIAVATTEMSVLDKHQALNQAVMMDDGVASLLVKASTPDAELSAIDEEKLFAFLYVDINTWMPIEVAYANGMLTRPSLDVVQTDIRDMLQYYTAIRPIIRQATSDYPLLGHTHVYIEMREALNELA